MISVDIKLLTSPASDSICLTLVDEISLTFFEEIKNIVSIELSKVLFINAF